MALSHGAGTGGGALEGCATGDVLSVLHPWSLERWRMGTPAPTLEARVVLPAGPARGMACVGGRIAIATAGGVDLGVEGGALAWQGAKPVGWPAAPEAGASREGAWRATTAGGQLVVGGPWGWGTQDADQRFTFWRGATGALADAVYDGQFVWAVGARGLWRWRPERGQPTPVVLPAVAAGAPLTGLFRDGRLLWVRSDTQAWPLLVRGTRAELAGRGGQPLPTDLSMTMPAGRGLLRATRGRPELVFEPAEGPRQVIATGIIHALASLAPAVVAVAVDDRLELWWFGRAQPERLEAYALGAAALRLFGVPGGLLVFTRSAGLIRLRLAEKPAAGDAPR